MKQRVYEVVDPKLDDYHLQLHEALFHNANGYIGIRYDFEEGYPETSSYIRSQYINGFFNYAAVCQPEGLYGLVREKQVMLDIANTQTIKLQVDGEPFSMFTGTVLKSKLTLDMNRGITVRDVVWRSSKGKELRLTVTRMASFHQLSLFTIEYEVEPLNFSGSFRIESDHNVNVENFFDPNDPRTAEEQVEGIIPIDCEIQDGASYVTSYARRSGLKVCSGVKNVMPDDWSPVFSVDHNAASCRFHVRAEQNETVGFVKYAVFSDSLRHGNCRIQARKEMKKALSLSIEDLYRRQEEYLAEYWKNCFIELQGSDEFDIALQYNLYQLIQSVGKDKHSSIAPKGLSGEGYEGHYFWDSEMYSQPFFTITNPSISKNLIEYRYETLEQARENARRLGQEKGAAYPWRTIMGKECSGYFPAGSAQYHINGDIAYSIIAYYLATKDLAFMKEKGAEILFETARLWMDIGNFYQGKFHINDVTGPDEYTCLVNNNYYTNVLAQYHLHWAVKFYSMLKDDEEFGRLVQRIGLTEQEIEEFSQAAEHMVLPYDEMLGINPQDDSFLQKKSWDRVFSFNNKEPLLLRYHPLHLYRYQICKQADTVLAHFILEDAETEEVIRRSYEYYEKITTHDSSLSRCIFCIMAARLGMEEKAFQYFGDAIKLDLMDLHNNTKDGIHTANMAGNYLAIVYGFAGFRLKESGVNFAPILHPGWTGYRFNIRWEDSRIFVEINCSECIFTLESGTPKNIRIYGNEYYLEDSLSVPLQSCPFDTARKVASS